MDRRERPGGARRRRAATRLEVICDTYLSVSTPVQVAAPALLEPARTIRAGDSPTNRAQSRARSALRRRAFPRSRCSSPKAAGRPCCACRRRSPRRSWCFGSSSEARVIVHPGYFFDFPDEAYLVMSLLPEPADLRRGHRPASARSSPEVALMGRHAGLHAAAVLAALHDELGHRRAAGSRAARALAADGGLRSSDAAADRRRWADGETSPYSAASAMAIDPIYIALDDVEDFARAGGIDALVAGHARRARRRARRHRRCSTTHVRRAKREALDDRLRAVRATTNGRS